MLIRVLILVSVINLHYNINAIKKIKESPFLKKQAPNCPGTHDSINGVCLFIYSLFLALIFYMLASKCSGHLVLVILPANKLLQCIPVSTCSAGKIPLLNN